MLKIRDSIECATVPYVGAAVSLPCPSFSTESRHVSKLSKTHPPKQMNLHQLCNKVVGI
jgi:hypothetical protein